MTGLLTRDPDDKEAHTITIRMIVWQPYMVQLARTRGIEKGVISSEIEQMIIDWLDGQGVKWRVSDADRRTSKENNMAKEE